MSVITELSHPNSIWTWTGIGKGRRFSLWLPYLQEIMRPNKKQWRFVYNGGEVTTRLDAMESMLVYGACREIPVALLDEMAVQNITLMIHRRNMPQPMVFYPLPATDNKDLLTKQILARENQKTATYVARTLIRARLQHFNGVHVSATILKKLGAVRTVSGVRSIEATQTRRYWDHYYAGLGFDGLTRRVEHPVNQALDALSFFLAGILLRWVLFHKLSPAHGFLHEQTNYIALVYDLIEPYRWLIEEAVSSAVRQYPTAIEEKTLVQHAINHLKESMEEDVYVPATRQVVARKNLLHGNVLALRSYLLGETRRFVVPVEGKRKGGRPPKVRYHIPGGRKPT